VREDRLLFLALTRDIERRRPLSFESGKWKHNAELEKWKLVRHSDEAFNIKAGAFEIEYFHGKTNIRVLDSSRVTVEGENRGEKLQAGLVGVLPAAYH
jgi:hypothetical protein